MAEVEVVKTKSKADNWSLAEIFSFAKLVKQHGKDWEKVTSDHASLNKYNRTEEEASKKYKNMKSAFTADYLIKKPLAEKRSNESEKAFAKRKSEFEKKHEYKREKHNEIVKIIKEVEEREIVASTAKKRTHQQMAEKISDAEAARKKQRLQTKQKIKDLANNEVKKVQEVTDFLGFAKQRIEWIEKVETALMTGLAQTNPVFVPLFREFLGQNPPTTSPEPSSGFASQETTATPTPQPLSRADLANIAETVLAEGFVNNTNN